MEFLTKRCIFLYFFSDFLPMLGFKADIFISNGAFLVKIYELSLGKTHNHQVTNFLWFSYAFPRYISF